MELPSFPAPSNDVSLIGTLYSPGAGTRLPIWLLALCGTFTAIATGVSIMSITLQLKNYRKPSLQRYVVRIMVMVPLYAISSLIAIFSLEAAFVIDAVRDLYEAFVIYTFFQLLITYLGGERSLLIILHGRPPAPHPTPFNWIYKPMDVSDPWTLLNLKRGVLQYVQVKPFLVIATIVLKATGLYQEGRFSADSGYTYVSILYNASICLSLYCLAMFWVCVSRDLTPFRPVPKFLCVKGILFFSFWQGIAVSLLVAAGLIKKVGVYTDAEHMSQALVDSLICFEMPIFAIAHQYAFRASDYIDPSLKHQARLPFTYALRDAFGLKDVWEDSKDTFRGQGISYQAYEPAEGALHYGLGRQKRIRAGLRYSKGGKAKYWLPTPGSSLTRGERGPIASLKRKLDKRRAAREGYAPLLPEQAARVVHDDPEESNDGFHRPEWSGLSTGLFTQSDSDGSDAASLDFDSVTDDEDNSYERARRIGYAGFPNIDVSQEEAKRKRWEEEEAILAGRRNDRTPGPSRQGSSSKVPTTENGKGKGKQAVYGACEWYDTPGNSRQVSSSSIRGRNPTGEGDWLVPAQQVDQKTSKKSRLDKLKPPMRRSQSNKSKNSAFAVGEDSDDEPPDTKSQIKRLPSDARDLVVEDPEAVEEARARERRRGEPQTKAPAHIYVHRHSPELQRVPSPRKSLDKPNGKSDPKESDPVDIEEVYSPPLPDEQPVSESVGENKPIADEMERIEQMKRAIMPTPPASRQTTMRTNFYDEDNPWA
ncbi:organic solute transporter Ostalpha-domain-containing protein [Kockovaella imperatae]|uniref:Organic solute transporter Ostalpha-domain-containing protein n=1 Tax=Kockovaella imperatae TaxID=4999 RepID=A0A1Y1U809_9TREE|nr:organic solute transporter Ostalpha-domain-containing protein [Kockovaella imperatae]ORX33656.1 organic solute transporter Ostalpha-domain-containing protein [Kockovaella imperatae]